MAGIVVDRGVKEKGAEGKTGRERGRKGREQHHQDQKGK